MKRNAGPPRIARALLEHLIEPGIRFGAMGDLEEQFYFITNEQGLFRARLRYWRQVAAALPGYICNVVYWSVAMLKAFFKSFFRNLRRHKGYSLINFAGLSVGLCIFILIMLFVRYEMGFDQFNERIDRIYHVQGAGGRQTTTAPAIGKWISEQIPEAENVVRFKFRNDYLASTFPEEDGVRAKSLVIRRFGWADAAVFDIFTFPLVAGDPRTALDGPFALVLSERLARRLFGTEYPVGKRIKINNRWDYRVTGVMKDQDRFHLDFECLASFETLGRIIGQSELDSFNSWNLSTYVLLPEQHDAAAVSGKITGLFKDKIYELTNRSLDFELDPLQGYYFRNASQGRRGNLQMVHVFVAIAVFILMIACVNFINLSTARASLRAREVGIKKVVGSTRKRLISQFMGESLIFSLFSFAAALALARLILPEFSRILQKQLAPGSLLDPMVLAGFTGGAVVVGIIAGIYPAFYLSSFRPAAVLKGDRCRGTGSGKLRKVLITAQFAVSIALIIATIVVYQQIRFAKSMDPGFQKDHIVFLQFARIGGIRSNKDAFKERLLQHPQVQAVTYSQGRPGLVYNWEGFEYQGNREGFAIFTVDPDFCDVYALEIIAGRNLSWDLKTDRLRKCLLNEAAVRKLELEEPVGTILHHDDLAGSSFPVKDIEVVGVIKDFHYQSLHYDIQPQMFGWNTPWFWMASIRIEPGDIPGTITYIRSLWKEFAPNFPFEYAFVDDLFDKQYQSEERLGRLIGYFSGLGIFIACLGLFGLASFMAEQRTKEIGIRKVLGAPVSGIVLLFSREFSKWVLAANLIAWPAAYAVMHVWLEGFAYRISLGLAAFLISALLALCIALLTVSLQSLRAAAADPIDSLRYE